MADATEEDFSQLPLPDRFTHKNWKVRKEGYEDAGKQFGKTPDESDPAFKPFLQDPGLWKGAAGDSNVAAQQEGLTALCAFLKYGGPQAASRTRSLTIEPIREKALSSTRPAAKAAALEAILLYVEIDKPDFVLEELLPAVSHKQPKVIAAALSTITAIVHNFGCKIVDPKPILKALPKAFGHADKNVRAEATNLTVELYRWLKEAIKPVFWNDLKPVQQQDLEKLFEKVKEEPAPKQERLTRAQQEAAAVAADSGGQNGGDGGMEEGEADEPVEIDTFDLAEPVDVFPKIPKDLHENLASSKWKERKEALDALLATLNTPRIKDGPFDEIIRDLAKIIQKDANVAVVTVAANCIEKLALGTKKGFAKYRSVIMSPMLERFKEKKQTVADALGAALDALFASTSFSDCLEETLGFIQHKNPQVKSETVKFLIRCLRNTREVPSKAEVKLIADAATKLLTESTEVMRSGGAEILGTLMKIMGERAMGPYLDGLDDIRKVKIKEYFDAAVVKAKDKPKPIAPPAKIAGTSAVGKKVAGSGMKKPAGVKKPAPAAAPSPQEEEPPALKPQSTGKSLAKPGLARPGSGVAAATGSKFGALKKPSSGLASPRRVISPPIHTEEDSQPPAAPSPAKFGLGRGGLAGRPLSKPTPASSSYTDLTPAPPSFPSSSLSTIERGELEELRAEKERLTALTDSLRSSNAKLSTEISELQNQNAQLIEDHTRDVLQIKAKETQLVRARGECDVLRAEVESAKKDIERQKREMSRLGRESFGRDQRDGMMQQQQMPSPQEDGGGIYSDNNSASGRPGSVLSRTGSSASVATANAGGGGGGGSRPPSYRKRFELNSPSEEKENNTTSAARSKAMSPNGSPQRSTAMWTTAGAVAQTDASSRNGNGGRERNSPVEPAENWKRAAEVTSQLKARIEQMKARQGLTRPLH